MKKLLLATIVFITMASFKADKPAYALYNAEGKQVKYAKMLDALQEADVVFYGELHDNPIAHWLELEITHDLYAARQGNLVLGADV